KKQYYPYQVYMNWPAEDQGNLLYNDKKFVTLLYKWNGDEFTKFSYVSDVSENTKNNIYRFLEESGKTVFVVDCENSDPYALCAAIRNLDEQRMKKIEKVVLYDDVHAASAWDILRNYISIPIEYILIERLKDKKSLADVKLTAGTCKEYYQNNVDSFVLVSSDSDYWGLIESIPEARFLVMVEHEKFSSTMKEALESKNIFFCYIDDFYTGNSMEIKTTSLIREASKYLAANCGFNINHLMDEIMTQTRIRMLPSEKKHFMEKYLRTFEVEIDDNGDVLLKVRKK
ncbi:MAG: NYN domain-containing protein, partial [Lachnospiraceae bacterium]|nr:NYN domain-containing protein [Lachnospiraceae bacterium]